MTTVLAHAKVNLALVVGPRRPDGKHDVVTVLQRVGIADRLSLSRSAEISVSGFSDDTLVRAALERLATAAGHSGGWAVHVEKHIPVAAGLGGGSSDAAAALLLANATLPQPVPPEGIEAIARAVGSDVPFFLHAGPQLGTDDGSTVSPLVLPSRYEVVLVLPHGEAKLSTRSVYEEFDEREGADGFGDRRAALLATLAAVADEDDLAGLPTNDLATSPVAGRLLELGAFRADVSGAGPTVYGLFRDAARAEAAAVALRDAGRVWRTRPV